LCPLCPFCQALRAKKTHRYRSPQIPALGALFSHDQYTLYVMSASYSRFVPVLTHPALSNICVALLSRAMHETLNRPVAFDGVSIWAGRL
jgi:hypothetical protein